jgi:hypothetical protein
MITEPQQLLLSQAWQCWASPLIAVYDADENGIFTYKLLYQLGSTNHAKAFISRAKRQGYIKICLQCFHI